MTSPFPPDYEPPGSRSRFQFNLRTLLALTALTAWLFGWAGAAGTGVFILLVFLALIEAGCTPGANVLGVFVRNLFAYFVCSLVFGAVGFGLMYGSNPTGWFGTDQFLFAPLLTEKVPELAGNWDPSNPEDVARMRAAELPFRLQAGTVLCVMVVVIAHRVLAERRRVAAYLVFWIITAALIYPLLGSWAAGGFFQDKGWLVQLGFGRERPDLSEIAVSQIVAGGAALAGVLVLGRRSRREGRCLALHSPYCRRWLVGIGLGVPWIFYGIGPTVTMLVSPASGAPAGYTARLTWTPMAMAMAGAFGALVASLLWQRRFHLPLILGSGISSVLVCLTGALMVGPMWGAVIGLLTGVMVVGTSWLLESLHVDDPGGAVAVHAVGGGLGILCAGIFANAFSVVIPGPGRVVPDWHRLWPQLFGIAVCFVWSFGASAAVFYLIKYMPGLCTTQEPTAK